MVDVVVVNWNGGAHLERCLDSLARDVASSPDEGPAYEIWLVDNGSVDGSGERAEARHPALHVVQLDHNAGFTGGANAGIAASSGDVIVLVNNDAVVLSGFLSALTAPVLAASHVGAATGRVLLDGRFVEASHATPRSETFLGHRGERWRRVRTADPDEGVLLVNSTGNEVTRSGNGRDRGWLTPATSAPAPADVFGFNGGSAALRRDALVQVGTFDESLFMYYEDTELSWRLRRAGWSVVHVHEAVTQHAHAASSGTSSHFFQAHNARNRLVVAVLHAPGPVVVRAFLRTGARSLRGPDRALWVRALGAALARMPSLLRQRRALSSRASVRRTEVARHLVPD